MQIIPPGIKKNAIFANTNFIKTKNMKPNMKIFDIFSPKGDINPAITLGVALSGRMSWKDGVWTALTCDCKK